MSLTYKLVTDELGIAQLACVASEIWYEYWPSIIGQEQTEYMVQNFQSETAIAKDIAQHGYQYSLLYDEEGDCVGYTAVAIEDFTDNPNDPAASVHGAKINEISLRRLFISKIYLYAKDRGKHYASQVIKHHEEFSQENGCPVMYLTVNINNELGVRAYLGKGFKVIEDFQGDIGNGFIMDDHIMAKEL